MSWFSGGYWEWHSQVIFMRRLCVRMERTNRVHLYGKIRTGIAILCLDYEAMGRYKWEKNYNQVNESQESLWQLQIIGGQPYSRKIKEELCNGQNERWPHHRLAKYCAICYQGDTAEWKKYFPHSQSTGKLAINHKLLKNRSWKGD